MSTEFTYGGIDRRSIAWPYKGESSPHRSTYDGPNRNENSNGARDQARKQGYLYGGRDRSKVNWTKTDDR